MKNIEKYIKNINIDYVFYFFLIAFFVFSLFFSTFRDAIRDEVIYMHETYLIAELLKNGFWIGDYAVGLHGFLFKIPPAIVFIFAGPSVAVVTLYNLLIALAVSIFFYKFLKKAFGWNLTALLVTGILMANFHFILSTPTYLREMPSLLVTVLLFYGISRNWKPWALGLVFLLLLDAKEYLFFMFGLGYFVWLVIKYFSLRETWYLKCKKVFLDSLQLFLPSLLFMVLMFTTSIIPINMFLASTLGFIDVGMSYLTAHFAPDIATSNLLDGEEVRTIYTFHIDEDYPMFLQMLLNFLNVVLSYIGKLLYPRTFSFLSVPKVILLPAVYMSIKMFFDSYKNRKKSPNNLNLIFPVLFIVYLLLYLLRASHGRYLLPAVPLVSIYFIYFLYYKYHDFKNLKKVLLATFVFILLGFYFESGYLFYKVVLELSIFILIIISVLKPFDLPNKFYTVFRKATVAFCFLSMFCVSILFAVTQGQAKYFNVFGMNREIVDITNMLPQDKKIWINNMESYDLMAVKYGQTYARPEWKWDLAEFIPKKNLLKTYGEKYLYNDIWIDIEEFKYYVLENDIEYVVLLESELEGYEIRLQEHLEDLQNKYWLEQESVEELKNKRIHIFRVELE